MYIYICIYIYIYVCSYGLRSGNCQPYTIVQFMRILALWRVGMSGNFQPLFMSRQPVSPQPAAKIGFETLRTRWFGRDAFFNPMVRKEASRCVEMCVVVCFPWEVRHVGYVWDMCGICVGYVYNICIYIYVYIHIYIYMCVYIYRRKFRSQTSDNMERWKKLSQEGGHGLLVIYIMLVPMAWLNKYL